MNSNKIIDNVGKKHKSNTDSNKEHHLVILLNGEKYFIPLVLVTRIIKEKEIFPMPETYDFIEGVFNFFGEIVPVVNMKKILKLSELEFQEKKFIICKILGINLCFVIDDVEAEWEIDTEKIKIDTVKVIENEFISGEYIHEGEVIGIIDVLNIVSTYRFKG